MSVSVGDFVQIVAKMKMLGTEDVLNIYTYRVDVNTSLDDDDFMVRVAGLIDNAYSFIVSDLSTVLTFDSVDGTNISKSELLPAKAWPTLVAGLDTFSPLPTQVAACVFWRTTTPKVRTSAFIGGYASDQNTPTAEVAPTAQAALLSFGNEIRDGITDAAITLVKGSFNPVKVLFTEAGQTVVPVRWRTQRRRRVGVGS